LHPAQTADSSEAPQLEQNRPVPRVEHAAQTTSEVEGCVMATTYTRARRGAGHYNCRVRIVLSNASFKWGGVHLITEILSREFQRRGHDVVVFGYPGGELEQRLQGSVEFEAILKGMDLHPGVLTRAGRALRRHRAEVVLALMRKDVRLTVPAAWAQGIPSIVRHANDRPLTGWIYDRALFGALPVAHIANSRATRDTLLRSASWLDPEKVLVVYNGIDIEKFDSAEPADLGLPPGAVAIGFVGRLQRRKGLIDLARAWPAVAAAVPNAHLVIVGKGPDEQEARDMLAGSDRVRWLGYRADVPQILKALDIVAMPSHWEGFGLTAAEGLVSGAGVIVTNVSSLPEIVTDREHGLLVPPHDPVALAKALVEMAAHPDERTRMARAGRERVMRDFTADRMVDEYEEILQRAVDRQL
jgi:glycosyltransferase involved in cell wall biosynthesis